MRRLIVVLFIMLLLLTGCGEVEEPVVEVVVPPLRQVSDSIIWDNITLQAITPVTAFELSGTSLHIFPYNDNSKYISIERYVFSDRDAFGLLMSQCDVNNTFSNGKWNLCTLSNGTTYVLVYLSDDTGYLINSTSLPSAYCTKVAEQLCQQLGL